MRIRGVPVTALAEAAVVLALRRLRTSPRQLRALLSDGSGRAPLTRDERRVATGVDAALRRLGVRCLWRAVVVTELLRRRGVAARVRLSISATDPSDGHAEVEVGGVPLRATPSEHVALR